MLTALFVSLAPVMVAAKKGKCLGGCGASSVHATKRSKLYSLDIYGLNVVNNQAY